MELFEYDGRAGRSLNLAGFLNAQTPVNVDVLKQLASKGAAIIITPEKQRQLSEDLVKASESTFDGADKVADIIGEIKTFRRVLVDDCGKIETYLFKAVAISEDSLEKAIDSYDLRHGIAVGGKEVCLKKTGAEIKAALGVVKAKYLEDAANIQAEMGILVAEIGEAPTEKSDDASCGNRYGWDTIRSNSQVISGDFYGRDANGGTSKMEIYNGRHYVLCGLMKTTRLIDAYSNQLTDATEYELKPELYLQIF